MDNAEVAVSPFTLCLPPHNRFCTHVHDPCTIQFCLVSQVYAICFTPHSNPGLDPRPAVFGVVQRLQEAIEDDPTHTDQQVRDHTHTHMHARTHTHTHTHTHMCTQTHVYVYVAHTCAHKHTAQTHTHSTHQVCTHQPIHNSKHYSSPVSRNYTNTNTGTHVHKTIPHSILLQCNDSYTQLRI